MMQIITLRFVTLNQLSLFLNVGKNCNQNILNLTGVFTISNHRHDVKTNMGIAYCAFHAGEYK